MSQRTLEQLLRVIKKNKKKNIKISYTAQLFNSGLKNCKKKFLEEVKEFIISFEKSKKNIIHEAADLIYHFLVLLEFKKVSFRQVVVELKKRSKISGIQEKLNRKLKKK
jgi:phosphoribosyl-ATP pyrophosphohydrolase